MAKRASREHRVIVSSRARSLAPLSAKYVLSGGKGQAAYELTQRLEDPRCGQFLPNKAVPKQV